MRHGRALDVGPARQARALLQAMKARPSGAVREGIARAHKTIENVAGAWISEQKVEVRDARIVNYRVTMRVTFVLKDED